MINPEIFFALANTLNLFANYNNIKTLWDNHNNLKGFSFQGACITIVVLTLLNIGFLIMDSWINVILLTPSLYYYINVAYWNSPYNIGYIDEWGDEYNILHKKHRDERFK